MWEIQTDLALEQRERFKGTETEIEGVILEKKRCRTDGILITRIEITNENGSEVMRKPRGTYLTLEFQEDTPEETLAEQVKALLQRLLPKKVETVLVAGLGNADMTADALGPETVEKLTVTRAISDTQKGMAAIAPGVMAQTGMESAEIIAGVCDRIRPDAVIAIDALAARSSLRLGKTIQMTDTGIQPGSGIGNSRQSLDKNTLGIPVIAIGVPTVVSAASIVCDALQAMEEVFDGHQMLGSLEELEEGEKRQLIMEVMNPKIGNLYVAPKDMDTMVLQMSRLLSGVLDQIFVQ